ncbi:MAG: zinc dependent phospholipase C family protein [Clostridiales bacterium]
MLINSHWILANKLFVKSKSYPFKLNHLALCWGSIRPDIHSPFNRGSHKYDISYQMIEKKWAKLMDDPRAFAWLYSYRLGFIMHYLADFFCYPHNTDYYDGNLKEHFQYEVLLHFYIKDFAVSDFAADNIQSVAHFHQYLEQQREEYFSQEPFLEKDMEFICQSSWVLLQYAMARAGKRRLAFA